MPAFLAALPALASLFGAGANVATGAAGAAASGAEREKQRALLEQILHQYSDLELPGQDELSTQLGPSAMEGVAGSVDPRLRTEQMGALESLGQFAETGDTAGSKAAMHRILNDVARQEGAGRNAILNNMRARGVSGSGAELAAQLSNQQASADRAQTAGLDQAANAQKRMLDAMLSKGRLAGDMRQQDYGEKSDAARARDMISRYNADARTRGAQQNFDNRYRVVQGKANAATGVANMYGQAADRASQTAAGVGAGINQAATGVGAALGGSDKPASTATGGYGSYGYSPTAPGEDDGIPYYLRKP